MDIIWLFFSLLLLEIRAIYALPIIHFPLLVLVTEMKKFRRFFSKMLFCKNPFIWLFFSFCKYFVIGAKFCCVIDVKSCTLVTHTLTRTFIKLILVAWE